MTQHTPGPWKLLVTRTGDGTEWLRIEPVGLQLPGNAKRSDAEYIVTACNRYPDMLEALQGLVIAANTNQPLDWRKARAVLKRIDGDH